MRAVILLCALLGFTSARPQNPIQRFIQGAIPYIVRYDYDNNGFGGFSFSVDTSNGIHQDQTGELKNAGQPDEHESVYGHYSYVGDDGKDYYVEYKADENGYQAAGDHIPKAASIGKVGQLGIPSSALASIAGGGLG